MVVVIPDPILGSNEKSCLGLCKLYVLKCIAVLVSDLALVLLVIVLNKAEHLMPRTNDRFV